MITILTSALEMCKGLIVGIIFCCAFMLSCFVCHLFIALLQYLYRRIIFPLPRQLYKCDPEKNKKCRNREHCYINGGPCDCTRYKKFAKAKEGKKNDSN